MDFSLKIQNLGIENSPVDGRLSISHEFDIPDDQIETKRGHLFAILDISVKADFDLSAIAKLFIDNIQENYYRTSEDTPLHAIEKSLNKAKTQILGFKSTNEKLSLGSPETELRLSFCTALIWNKILYTSYFGKPAAYLIRGTGARNLGINTTEQEIWTNSSILDDEDVILIGTEHFATRFPATEIINNLGSISQEIATSENSNDLVAILIKVASNEERKKPNLIENIKNADIKGTISTSFWKLKEKVLQNDKLSDKFKIYQRKKVAPISSITGLTKTIASEDLKSGSNLSKIKRISKNGTKNKKIKRLAVGLVMLSIFGFMNMKLFYNKNEPETRALLSSKITQTENKNSDVMGTNTKSDKIDALINLQSVTGKSSPMVISYMKDDRIMTLDIVSHNLYQTEISTKDSKSLTDEFERPMLLKCGATYCYVYGNKTLYVVDPKNPDRIEKYLINIDDVVDIEPFGNAVYFLTSNNIHMHTLLSDESESWLKEGETINADAKSFSINSDIYVLADRNILKYVNGRLQKDFTLDNSHLLEPIQIEVSTKYIFVLDTAQNNLVIYNKNNSSFYKKIPISDETSANNPDSFVIAENSASQNPTVIIKSGNYLYQLDNASLYKK